MMPRTFGGRQQGVVMVIALIMLLAVTLMVVTASNLVNANLKAVQNVEIREQARVSAYAAIEEALSNGLAGVVPRFISNPDDVFINSCDGTTLTCTKVNNLKYYDTNADGVADISVRLSDPDNPDVYPPPSCILARTKLNDELNDAEIAYLCEGPSFNPSQAPDPKAKSDCAESIWELKALATDLVTGAEVVVRQGVAVSIREGDKVSYCGPVVSPPPPTP